MAARTILVSMLVLATLAGCAAPAAAPPAPTPSAPAAEPVAPAAPALGTFGIDLRWQDTAIHPGDDFFRFANNRWLQTFEIPPDRQRWGAFDELAALSEQRVKAIIEEMAANAATAPGDARKVADLYNAFMDEARIEALGVTPLRADLAAIDAAADRSALARLWGAPGIPSPLGVSIGLDAKNPDRYLLAASQAGALGMPDRSFYLEERFATQRAAYATFLETMFRLAGQADPAGQAARVIALETEVARVQWTREQTRDRDRTYNLVSTTDLAATAPGIDWRAMLAGKGIPEGRRDINLAHKDAIQAIARLVQSQPLDTWRSWTRAAVLRGAAPMLSRDFARAHFEFYGRTLGGQPEERERWKRGVELVNGTLGEAVGRIYVERHFPPDAKAKMDELVANSMRAMRTRLENVAWMGPETRARALEKLSTFRTKIGYPSQWRDYSGLDIRADDLLGNVRRAAIFENARDVARLDGPVDREEWFMTPQTVNAYYNPSFNEIVFPAAILQPPFFDPNADPAVNYGGIGMVIGHEISHGFDDQGSKSDAQGRLNSWWTDADRAAFEARAQVLVDQYSAFEPLPGFFINGRLSLGENIADVAGIKIALDAYRLSLGGRPAPVIDGFSGEQRFFLSHAQIWRGMQREEALRRQLMVGPHSPGEFRVNGVVRNIDEWYEAFGVTSANRLYVPQDRRVDIW
jgi:putative endopeptidase